jgi:hypothetical protein
LQHVLVGFGVEPDIAAVADEDREVSQWLAVTRSAARSGLEPKAADQALPTVKATTAGVSKTNDSPDNACRFEDIAYSFRIRLESKRCKSASQSPAPALGEARCWHRFAELYAR